MKIIDIVILISCLLIVVAVVSLYIYKKSKGINTECSCCKSNSKRMIKNVKKELEKDEEESCCCCK